MDRNSFDENPLADVDLSDGSSCDTSVEDLSLSKTLIQTPPHTVLQTVNIHTHVPVELSIAESNYAEWKSFFDTFIGKFGLRSHLTTTPTSANRRDAKWVMVDQCILSWLYNSTSKDVRSIIRTPKATAFKVWNAICDQFRDNELHRAVYLEAEFRNLVQGDMDIIAYTGRLKHLADALRNVGQPVRETPRC